MTRARRRSGHCTAPFVERSAVNVPTPSDVCSFVDGLDPDEVGELRISHRGHPLGAVFVQNNRVCWVAAAGLERTLSQLLVERAGITRDAMERHFERCRAAKVPVGEDLVDRGVIGPNALRGALFDHSTASLASLCRDGARAEWRPRTRTYAARFTFSTSELLVRTNALSRADVAEAATLSIRDLFDAAEGDWAVAFVRCSERAIPIAVALLGAFPARASALSSHAKWAMSCLDVAGTFAGARPSVVATTSGAEPRFCCALREAAYFVVGETDAAGAARISSRRLAVGSFVKEVVSWNP